MSSNTQRFFVLTRVYSERGDTDMTDKVMFTLTGSKAGKYIYDCATTYVLCTRMNQIIVKC